MKNNLSKIINFFLISITFGLIFLIFYISNLLLKENKTTSSITPRKIKASNITYSKVINLDQSLNTTPTSNPEITQSNKNQLLPTPTEIILAYNNNSYLETPTIETPTPTKTITKKITEIPQSGTIYQTLIIFASASIFVFFAFLF